MNRFFSLLFIFVCTVANAQVDKPESGELWSGATFKWKLNKKLKLQIEEQVRVWENLGSIKGSFTEIGAEYELFKDFEIAGRYRFTIVPNSFADDAIEKSAFNRSRFSLDLKYELDKKGFPLSLSYRQRIQDTRELYTDYKITYWRNRFSLEWEATDDITPFFEYESFYRFNTKNEFRGNRYSLGIDWRINKEMDLSTFYRIDQQINTKVNSRENIVGIMYSYTLKRKKKKD